MPDQADYFCPRLVLKREPDKAPSYRLDVYPPHATLNAAPIATALLGPLKALQRFRPLTARLLADDATAAEELGDCVAAWLFTQQEQLSETLSPVWNAVGRYLTSLPAQGDTPLRLWLCLDPSVSNLPEFYLGVVPLQALDANRLLPVQVLRGTGGEMLPSRPLKIATKLKVLLICANPDPGHDRPGGDHIPGLEAQLRAMQSGLDELVRREALFVKVCQPPTKDRLIQEIRVFKPHVLCFIGHGWGPESGHGGLVCVRDGAPDWLSFEEPEFQQVIQASNLCLAVLVACRSFSAAPYLMDAGVPAIVAISPLAVGYGQKEIFDFPAECASRFGRPFFTALARTHDQEGGIGAAFFAARAALEKGPHPAAALMPTLWLADPNASLLASAVERLRVAYRESLLARLHDMPVRPTSFSDTTYEALVVDQEIVRQRVPERRTDRSDPNVNTVMDREHAALQDDTHHELESEVVDLLATLEAQHLVAIRAPAWAGKSTLCRTVVRECEARLGLLPIFIELRRLASSGLSLRNYLDQEYTGWLALEGQSISGADDGVQPISAGLWAYQQWMSGQALLIADGADEVHEGETRRRILDSLCPSTDRNVQPYVLLTSRPLDPAEFSRYEVLGLKELSSDCVAQLINKCAAALDRSDLIAGFLSALRADTSVAAIPAWPGHVVKRFEYFATKGVIPDWDEDLISDVADLRLALPPLVSQGEEPEASGSRSARSNRSKPRLTLDQQQIIDGYLTAILHSFQYAPKPVHGRNQYRQMRLDRVYVSLSLYPGSNYEISAHASKTDNLGSTFDPVALQRLGTYRGHTAPLPNAASLESVLERHASALIMGDPGSGKTSLLYQIAVRYASAKNRPGGENQPLPIFVRAADLATSAEEQKLNAGQQGTLKWFLGRQTLKAQPYYPGERSDEPIDPDDLNRTLLEELQSNGGVVLIDGLDEVDDKERRRKVSNLIDAFLDDLATNKTLYSRNGHSVKVLITSRQVGYEQAPLNSDVVRYVIKPLDDDAIHKLSHNCMEAMCPLAEDGPRIATEFLSQLMAPQHERLRSVAENPFLLTLLCSVYLDHKGLPTNRASLYRDVVDNNLLELLSELHGSRNTAGILNIITQVGYDIHRESLTGRVSKTQLLKMLADYKKQEKEETLSPEALFQLITEKSGLMVDRGPGEYAFVHRSLQEDMAGRYLLKRMEQGQLDVLSFVQHSADSRWSEPVLLALGYASLHDSSHDPESYAKLLDDILRVDFQDDAAIPHGSILLARAYYEAEAYPRSIRLRLLGKLIGGYCGSTFLSELPPFCGFVEDLIATIWGRSKPGSQEELDIEGILVTQLTGSDAGATRQAAQLIHTCRLYSDGIAVALVSAQRHDSAATNWTIHRTLHVLVTRPEIEKWFDFKPIPSGLLTSSGVDQVFARFAEGTRVQMASPERLKMRRKLRQLKLSNLVFRSELLDRPDLEARISTSEAWSTYIAHLGIGGFGDFEVEWLNKMKLGLSLAIDRSIGSATERHQWAIHLDTALTPLLTCLKKRTIDFRADWLISDPPDPHGLLDSLEAGEDPPRIEHRASARYVNYDAIWQNDLAASVARRLQFETDYVAQSHLWTHRLLATESSDLPYNIAVILDTYGDTLAANPATLVRGLGLTALSLNHQQLEPTLRRKFWQPRRLNDFFAFALDLLDGLDDSCGFLHTWFLMQVRPLLATDGELANFMVEAMVRVMRLRPGEFTLNDALLVLPEALRNLPFPEFLQELVAIAAAIPDPYIQIRAFIALYRVSPMRFHALRGRISTLIDQIPDTLDRQIALGLLNSAGIRLPQHAEYDEIPVWNATDIVLPEEIETEPDTDSPGAVALFNLQSFCRSMGENANEDSEAVWDLLQRDQSGGVKAFWRHVRQGWMDLTSSGLEVFRMLPTEMRRQMLPYLTSLNESLLTEFAVESREFKNHMALIAAENGRWSVEGMRVLSVMLKSEQDVWRLRAQNVLNSRNLTSTMVGEEVLLEAARLYQLHPGRDTLRWYLAMLRHDNPAMVVAWCRRLDAGSVDKRYHLLLKYTQNFTEPVWKTMFQCLIDGSPATQYAILVALRTVAEEGMPRFCNLEELNRALAQIIDQNRARELSACAYDIMGFLMPGEGGQLLNEERTYAHPQVFAAAVVAAGRRGGCNEALQKLLSENSSSAIREALLTAFVLSEIPIPSAACQMASHWQEMTGALIAVCNTRIVNDHYRTAVQAAALFVKEHWDKGNDAPLQALLELIGAALHEDRTQRVSGKMRMEHNLMELRDVLTIAAAVAEENFARFSEIFVAKRPSWEAKLIELAQFDPSFSVRSACLRLLSLMPEIDVAVLDAVLAGLTDVAQVALIAEDLIRYLPIPSEDARVELLQTLQQSGNSRAVAAGKILVAAIEREQDVTDRQRWRDELVATLNGLLQSDRALRPVVRISGLNGRRSEFMGSQTLREALGEILFRLQAIPLPGHPREIQSRDQVARAIFNIPSVDTEAAFGPMEIGELLTSDDPWTHQAHNRVIDPETAAALREILDFCRANQLSIVEVTQKLLKERFWAEENRS